MHATAAEGAGHPRAERPLAIVYAAGFACVLLALTAVIGAALASGARYLVMPERPIEGYLELVGVLVVTVTLALLLAWGIAQTWRGRAMGRIVLTWAFALAALAAATLVPLLVLLGLGAIVGVAALFSKPAQAWFARR